MSEHTGRIIEVPVGGSTAEAYLTGEVDGPPRPGVLLHMDAIGLRPRLYEIADRIASWGYVVLAPHAFHRDGRVEELAPTTDLRVPENRKAYVDGAMERVRALTTDLAESDARAWVEHLLTVATAPIGTVGYCMGARLAVRTAGAHPDLVSAVAGFHGAGLVTDSPDSPHLLVEGTRAEYVFGHADEDPSMPPEAVTALGAALEAAGVPHTNEVYAGAPHGFAMSDTAAYDEEAAERSFTVLQELLDRSVGIPAG